MATPFYQTETELNDLHTRLKLMPCPHCRRYGYLVLHGYLYGYTDRPDSHRINRGRRIFCSNRKNRNGCGGTFSILKATLLKGFRMTTHTLWQYLENMLNGMNKLQAFAHSGSTLYPTSAYRLYKRFKQGQSRIRTLLSRITPPPCLTHTPDPVLLTLLHLKTTFNACQCPIAEFQHRFQISFLT